MLIITIYLSIYLYIYIYIYIFYFFRLSSGRDRQNPIHTSYRFLIVYIITKVSQVYVGYITRVCVVTNVSIV